MIFAICRGSILSYIAVFNGSYIDPHGSVIFPLRGSDIIFAFKTARSAISLGASRISLQRNKTREGEYN